MELRICKQYVSGKNNKQQEGEIMNIIKFKDLAVNTTNDVYALLRDVQEKKSKNGSVYVCVTLFDGTSEIKANMWRTTKAACGFTDMNIVVSAAIETSTYNGNNSYVVKNMRVTDASDGVKVSDYIPTAPVNPEELYNQCLDIINSIDNQDIALLAMDIYHTYKERLLTWRSQNTSS